MFAQSDYRPPFHTIQCITFMKAPAFLLLGFLLRRDGVSAVILQFVLSKLRAAFAVGLQGSFVVVLAGDRDDWVDVGSECNCS